MKNNKILILLIFFLILPFFLPASGFCELKAMNDGELLDIYATGFSSFDIIHNTDTGYDEARAWFNIRAFTYTEIDSLKLGYHDEYDYKDPTPGFNWDEDWVNVVFGTAIDEPENDFYGEGFYFTAAFENIDNPNTRELKSVKFGFETVSGDITANFNSFSGTINDGAGAPEYNGHTLNLGLATITNNGNGGMEISLNIENYDKGYWVTFDDAVVTP